MRSTFTQVSALALALALGLPLTAGAQTAPGNDPHHPGTPPAAAPGTATPTQPPAAAGAPQLGMMMGDMQQMMGMMGQMMGMMQTMAGGPNGPGRGMPGGGMPRAGMPGAGMQGAGMPGIGPWNNGACGGGGLAMGTMGGGGAGSGFGMGGRGPGAMTGFGGPMAGRYAAGMVAFYKAELDITAAQEPQWSAFAAAMRGGLDAMRAAAAQRMSGGQPQSAPERMDAHVARLSTALEAAKAMATAGKALYAVLTPEQREIADQFMTHRGWGMTP
jgi:hypothetical protein